MSCTRYFIRALALLLAALALSTCDQGEEFPALDNTAEREAFYQRYNRSSEKETVAAIQSLEKEITAANDEVIRQEKTKALQLKQHRLAGGDFFQWNEESALPQGLSWITNDADPDIGSPNAKKGGVYRSYIHGLAYPPTIRCLGKSANNSFRSNHWDYIELGMVGTHPNTGNLIPCLADRWAVAEDMQTVYFHIDDAAKWSDGEEVVTDDFFMAFYIYLSPYLTEPWYRTYYGEQFNGITSYGKDYIAVKLANPKPRTAFFANLVPFQAKFYKEFGPDFEERYNWRPRPTTGAYQILPEDIVKGRSISLSRVKNWWALERKYYRNLFNPDKLEYKFIRDTEKVFILFKHGEIDVFPVINNMKYWHEKAEIPQIFQGYIHKATFYNEYPRAPIGLYFNQADPLLGNRDIRIGLQHATHWERVIAYDMRGDASRLQILNDGFGRFSNANIKTREFSPEKAADAFARAGYTSRNADGLLTNAKGETLSFTITYTKAALYDQILQRLKEEAKKAGVEYKLESLDGTASFLKTSLKKQQITLASWGITPPYPDYFEFLHSKDAFEPGTRSPRPMTNNIFTYANPETDKLLEANRNAISEEDIVRSSHAIEEIIHEDAIWSPGWKKETYRALYWRWIQWPDDFNVRITDEPEMSYVFWIDEDIKKDTQNAMREGRSFPESNRIFDTYRQRPASRPQP
jgi:microcin C transport system substrate-binding protein